MYMYVGADLCICVFMVFLCVVLCIYVCVWACL